MNAYLVDVETGYVKVYDALFDRLQELPLLVVFHKVLHHRRGDVGQLITEDVWLQTLEKGCPGNGVTTELVVDPTKQHVPTNTREDYVVLKYLHIE